MEDLLVLYNVQEAELREVGENEDFVQDDQWQVYLSH